MCKKMIALFRQQSAPAELPYPEEPVDDSLTTLNTNADEILQRWLTQRGVPSEHWAFWKLKIDIRLYDKWPPEMLNRGILTDTPAGTWTENNVRVLASLTRWFNVGVIAHEQAHNSYALLSKYGRLKFAVVYNILRHFNPLIKLLYSMNTYGLSSNVEGHAEIYRYIGEKMPACLKQSYPKLF